LKVRHTALKAINRLRYAHPEIIFDDEQFLGLVLEETQIYQDWLTMVYLHKRLLKQEKKQFLKRYEARKNLIQLLEKRLDTNLQRLFLALGLKYSPEDMISIFRSIRGKKAEVRINALEFLDNILGINLKKIIIPIIETTLLDNLTERAIQQLKLHIPDELKCYERLLAISQPKVTVALVELLEHLEEERFKPLLAKALLVKTQRADGTLLRAWAA